jgi:hypothetical protein
MKKAAVVESIMGRPRLLENDETAMIGVKLPVTYKTDLINISHNLGMSHSHLVRKILTQFVDDHRRQTAKELLDVR